MLQTFGMEGMKSQQKASNINTYTECHSETWPENEAFSSYPFGHSFTVNCVINGKATQGVVDSGARCTMASYNLIKSLEQLSRLESAASNAPYLRGIGGVPEQPKWKLNAEIQLQGRMFLYDILVIENHSEEVLLFGTDFNHHARLMIDFYDKTVSFKDEWQRRAKVEKTRLGIKSHKNRIQRRPSLIATKQVSQLKYRSPLLDISQVLPINIKSPIKNKAPPDVPPREFNQMEAALASVAFCNSGYRIPRFSTANLRKSQCTQSRSPLDYSYDSSYKQCTVDSRQIQFGRFRPETSKSKTSRCR